MSAYSHSLGWEAKSWMKPQTETRLTWEQSNQFCRDAQLVLKFIEETSGHKKSQSSSQTSSNTRERPLQCCSVVLRVIEGGGRDYWIFSLVWRRSCAARQLVSHAVHFQASGRAVCRRTTQNVPLGSAVSIFFRPWTLLNRTAARWRGKTSPIE